MEQHRLVMECVLGRLLGSKEIVHHKNRIRHDNRACNLEVMTRREHSLSHIEDIRAAVLADLDEPRVRAALQGRTTLEAARLLGVNHQTLRNRFLHLLSKRRSPGCPFPPEVVEKVRLLAADPSIEACRAARSLGMCYRTFHVCMKYHGIPWTPRPGGRPRKSASRETGDRN